MIKKTHYEKAVTKKKDNILHNKYIVFSNYILQFILKIISNNNQKEYTEYTRKRTRSLKAANFSQQGTNSTNDVQPKKKESRTHTMYMVDMPNRTV